MTDNTNEKIIKPLDETDWKILKELQEDASITDTTLGKRIHHSSPGDKKHALEKAKVIVGYHAEIDPAKVGLPVTAFILIKFADKDNGSEVMKIVEELPEIIECHTCYSETSYILKVVTALNENLKDITKKLTPYGMTTTYIVRSSPIKHRAIKPPQKK